MACCNVNDEITFQYRGGRNYGGIRRVKVSQVDTWEISGVDLNDGNKFKKYTMNKVYNLKVATKARTDDDEFSDLKEFLGKNPTFGTSMINEFNRRHGTDLKWDAMRRAIIVSKTQATLPAVVKILGEDVEILIGDAKVKLSRWGSWTINDIQKKEPLEKIVESA